MKTTVTDLRVLGEAANTVYRSRIVKCPHLAALNRGVAWKSTKTACPYARGCPRYRFLCSGYFPQDSTTGGRTGEVHSGWRGTGSEAFDDQYNFIDNIYLRR